MKLTFNPFVLISFLLFSACHSAADSPERTPGKDTIVTDLAHPQLPPHKHNPEDRATVNKNPVATYREKTGLPEGDFVVRLYETSRTMYYRADMEYEGLPGTDTVKLPDLGTAPHPLLQKGTDRFSCIIGFMDNDKQFRELKLVRGKGNMLKVSSLRHWVVTDHFRLVSR